MPVPHGLPACSATWSCWPHERSPGRWRRNRDQRQRSINLPHLASADRLLGDSQQIGDHHCGRAGAAGVTRLYQRTCEAVFANNEKSYPELDQNVYAPR
jgi:hypothetical protein